MPLWHLLSSLTDKIFRGRKVRYMSVNTNLFFNCQTIINAVKKYASVIVVLDAGSFEDWESIASELEKCSRCVRICLVSGSDSEAVDAINRHTAVCGYVRERSLYEMYEEIIGRLCGKIRTICGGIAVTYYSSVDKVIPFDEIYYIETIKQTHMCRIVHKHGADEIRAEISKLIAELDPRFQYARSSTIINLSAVRAVRNSELFFPDGKSCVCTEKYASGILPAMKTAAII